MKIGQVRADLVGYLAGIMPIEELQRHADLLQEVYSRAFSAAEARRLVGIEIATIDLDSCFI